MGYLCDIPGLSNDDMPRSIRTRPLLTLLEGALMVIRAGEAKTQRWVTKLAAYFLAWWSKPCWLKSLHNKKECFFETPLTELQLNGSGGAARLSTRNPVGWRNCKDRRFLFKASTNENSPWCFAYSVLTFVFEYSEEHHETQGHTCYSVGNDARFQVLCSCVSVTGTRSIKRELQAKIDRYCWLYPFK